MAALICWTSVRSWNYWPLKKDANHPRPGKGVTIFGAKRAALIRNRRRKSNHCPGVGSRNLSCYPSPKTRKSTGDKGAKKQQITFIQISQRCDSGKSLETPSRKLDHRIVTAPIPKATMTHTQRYHAHNKTTGSFLDCSRRVGNAKHVQITIGIDQGASCPQSYDSIRDRLFSRLGGSVRLVG